MVPRNNTIRRSLNLQSSLGRNLALALQKPVDTRLRKASFVSQGLLRTAANFDSSFYVGNVIHGSAI
jgi:hypothetical protein